MQSLTLIVHVALAVAVIGLVLIQHGKGADAGAAFGSGASSTVFGSRGSASFLTRLTTILAALFFATSLILFYLAAHRDRGNASVTDSLPRTTIEAPLEVESDLPAVDGVTPNGGAESDVPAAGDEPATESDMPATEGSMNDAGPNDAGSNDAGSNDAGQGNSASSQNDEETAKE